MWMVTQSCSMIISNDLIMSVFVINRLPHITPSSAISSSINGSVATVRPVSSRALPPSPSWFTELSQSWYVRRNNGIGEKGNDEKSKAPTTKKEKTLLSSSSSVSNDGKESKTDNTSNSRSSKSKLNDNKNTNSISDNHGPLLAAFVFG
jgi:hypothetical protein